MPDQSPKREAFTGWKREKKTRFSVRFADFLSSRLIAIGGIGTIIAVSLVAVLLIAVAYPLFSSASISHPRRSPIAWQGKKPLKVTIDEYQTMGWALYGDGTLQVFALDTGQEIVSHALFEGNAKLTAISVIPDSEQGKGISNLQIAAGFDDGTVRFGTIGFETSFSEVAEVPAENRHMNIGDVAVIGEAVVQVTPQRQFRQQKVVYKFYRPVKFADASIELLAHGHRVGNFGVATYSADGKLTFGVAEQLITITKQINYRVSSKLKKQFDYDFSALGMPDFLLVPTRGNMAYVVWKDGHCARFDARVMADAQLAEELELLDDDGQHATAVEFALNRETLLVGDSKGTVRGWFPIDRGDAVKLQGALPTKDRLVLAPVHTLPSRDVGVASFGISERTRLIAVGYEDGDVRVFHVTTEQLVVDVHPAEGVPIDFVAIAPKDDGIIAATDKGLWRCDFEAGHPETTFASLFFPVWYEGEAEPNLTWQSSFAGVGPEMKLSLRPLIFGTIKATVYAMFFGTPLALLGAIYTSEFMSARAKATIKPAVEMMASLPSVVLGFLAALVFAPFVEQAVPMTLACFVTIPLVYILSAFLWQLLPHDKALAYQHFRFVICLLLLPVGLLFAWWLGPLVETALFASDIKLWLDGQIGSGAGAWMLTLFPLTALAVAFASGLGANGWLRRNSGGWSRRKFAFVNLAKFGVGLVATVAIAWLLSALLTAIRFDPRGSFVGTYDQRNAMVVGFVMGFAIIPIIYTIAEDALSTVPHHLRSASLGTGATPWQTTIRIVIPTAMSGLFSALMIGLGRAVGETMIVLMAGGNTPVRDWNIFNGFRTLAANIAVELPEAVQGESHYRTLFLCALTLFVMTFFVNTLAELVRLRFRKRAVQL